MAIEVEDRTESRPPASTREKHRARFGEVETLLIRRGMSPQAIAREISAKWSVSQRQVWRDIKALRVIYRERNPLLSAEEMRDIIIEDHRLAIDAGDHRAAHKHMELLARIQGQIQPARVEVEHKGQVNHAHLHVDASAIREALRNLPREQLDAIEAAAIRLLPALAEKP